MIPSYARDLVSAPTTLTLLPSPSKPKPPTPPTTSKRRKHVIETPLAARAYGRVIPDFVPAYKVGDRFGMVTLGMSHHLSVMVMVVGVTIVQPKNDGRMVDEPQTTAQYTLRADLRYGGEVYILREDALNRAVLRLQKKNARPVKATSVLTPYTATPTTNPNAA